MSPVFRFALLWPSSAWMRGALLGASLSFFFGVEAHPDSSRLDQVMELVMQRYVRPLSREELQEKALQGMLRGLDPYSDYLPPERYAELQNDTRGDYAGIGIVADKESGNFVVIDVATGSPAARAGMKAGDSLLSVGGQSTREMDLDAVVKVVRGEAGSRVSLSWGHQGEQRQASIVRESIATPTVMAAWAPLSTGKRSAVPIFRISRFSRSTYAELVDRINELATPDTGALILDLRGNPGGLLDSAVEVAGLFLHAGETVVQIQERGNLRTLRASGNKQKPTALDLQKLPLAVLIDGDSASAAEILAGALADHGRATLIGSKTFGKGSVQDIVELDGTHAVRFTIATCLTPRGTMVDKVGITPKISVTVPQAKQTAENAQRLFSRQLDLPPGDTAVDIAVKHLASGDRFSIQAARQP